MNPLIRSFIAVELSPQIIEKIDLISSQLNQKYHGGFRWVKTENIHLTLKFLGDASTSQLNSISKFLETHSRSIESFTIKINGFGAFPTWNHPRTLWIGMDPTPGLFNLYQSIDQATVSLGFPSEGRRFSPHLTLCRISDHADQNEVTEMMTDLVKIRSLSFGEMTIEKVTLFRSQLQSGGSVYTPISKHAFQPSSKL